MSLSHSARRAQKFIAGIDLVDPKDVIGFSGSIATNLFLDLADGRQVRISTMPALIALMGGWPEVALPKVETMDPLTAYDMAVHLDPEVRLEEAFGHANRPYDEALSHVMNVRPEGWPDGTGIPSADNREVAAQYLGAYAEDLAYRWPVQDVGNWIYSLLVHKLLDAQQIRLIESWYRSITHGAPSADHWQGEIRKVVSKLAQDHGRAYAHADDVGLELFTEDRQVEVTLTPSEIRILLGGDHNWDAFMTKATHYMCRRAQRGDEISLHILEILCGYTVDAVAFEKTRKQVVANAPALALQQEAEGEIKKRKAPTLQETARVVEA
jgi:hypothetical protein